MLTKFTREWQYVTRSHFPFPFSHSLFSLRKPSRRSEPPTVLFANAWVGQAEGLVQYFANRSLMSQSKLTLNLSRVLLRSTSLATLFLWEKLTPHCDELLLLDRNHASSLV